MEEKLRSEPETEEVSEASSSESKVLRRRGVKAPAPPRVNKSAGETHANKSLKRLLSDHGLPFQYAPRQEDILAWTHWTEHQTVY